MHKAQYQPHPFERLKHGRLDADIKKRPGPDITQIAAGNGIYLHKNGLNLPGC